MNKYLLLLILFLGNSFFINAHSLNMLHWVEACLSLPTNRPIGIRNISLRDSAFGEDVESARGIFSDSLDRVVSAMKSELNSALWLGNKYRSGFEPFAQKIELQPNDEVIFHGDFHGDVHSFVNELADLYNRGYLNENFEILKDNVYMAFLGDYVDRGYHGAEVIYTILMLKMANPEKVFMVRGNHEDIGIQIRYGFKDECSLKFGRGYHREIAKIYDLMPVVLYVGCGDSYLQCCHGGMEPGYNPSALLNSPYNFQLLGQLKRENFGELKGINRLLFYNFKPLSPSGGWSRRVEQGSGSIGFMWHDFDVENKETESISFKRGRGFSFSKKSTLSLLNYHNWGAKKQVRGVFRAHQHSSSLNPMMQGLIESKGVYKLWENYESTLYPKSRTISDGLVWTFNVAPDTNYGSGCDFSFDAYGMLTVQRNYEDWRLFVFNTDFQESSGFLYDLFYKAKGFLSRWFKIFTGR